MVISQRSNTIEHLVLDGHSVLFTYSFSPVSGKVVVKAKVSEITNVVPVEARHLLLAAVAPLHYMTSCSTTVDRGHNFSDGSAYANFWIKPVPSDAGQCQDWTVSPPISVDNVLVELGSSPLNPNTAEFMPAQDSQGLSSTSIDECGCDDEATVLQYANAPEPTDSPTLISQDVAAPSQGSTSQQVELHDKSVEDACCSEAKHQVQTLQAHLSRRNLCQPWMHRI